MKVEIFENKPIVEFEIFDNHEKWFMIDFLIDTWFTESIALIVDKNDSTLLKTIEIFDFKNLENEWIILWNWEFAKTSLWKINANFFWKIEKVNVLIIFWEKDDMPVVWIEFLKQNRKKLNLDFEKNIFELS